MAFFGRKPKKPGSVPGSASGFTQERRAERLSAVVERLESAGRPSRPGRASRALRAARTGRSAR